MTKLHGKLSQQLFPCKADPYLELYHGKMPTAEELQKQACLDQAHYLDKLDWELGRLFSRNSFEVPLHGFPQAGTGYHGLSGTRPGKKIISAHPYLTMKNIAPVINNMRRVKTPEEIAAIREAVRLTGLGIESILRHMKPA